MPPPDPIEPRPRTGGRVAGQSYASPPPAEAGKGSGFPRRDYSDVRPRVLRETYAMWQQVARDVADRRRDRRLEQREVAAAAGVTPNTVQRIEVGQWVAGHNLFAVCAALDLIVEQTVDLYEPSAPAAEDREARRRLARPAATDRVATRAEVLAGRAVLKALAAHHGLLEPRVDDAGRVYVRAPRSGRGALWRFEAVAAQTLGVGIDVSTDQDAADRAEAQLL